jgi:hypothetical protein
MLAILNHLRARLAERSFWLQIGTAIIPAAVLPWPWSAIVASTAVMAALVPDGKLPPAA